MFIIHKYEKYGNHLVSAGQIRGKFLSEEQAKLKIKSLDKSFHYEIREEYKPNFITIEDIKIGLKLFTAHPFYGIDEYTVLSTPKMSDMKHLYIDIESVSSWGKPYLNTKFLDDAGIMEHSYNDRRTFRSKIEAEKYIEHMLTLKETHMHHLHHLAMCEMLDEMSSDYYYDEM